MTKPIIFTKEEIETIKEMLYLIETKHEDYGKEAYYLRNLLERTNNNEQSEQMEIAREIMKQDSECLRNLSKNNDDSIKNFDS
jgi:hypothetical protein